MENTTLKAIESKLDLILRLLASRAIEKKSKKESILALSGLGFDRRSIADLVDTTPLTVSVIVSGSNRSRRLRNAAKSAAKRRRKEKP